MTLNPTEKDWPRGDLGPETEIRIVVTLPDDEESLNGPCDTNYSQWTHDPNRLFVLVHKPRPIGSSHGAKAFMVLDPQQDGGHTGSADSRETQDDSNSWLLRIIQDALERQARLSSNCHPSLATGSRCATPLHAGRPTVPIRKFTGPSTALLAPGFSSSVLRPTRPAARTVDMTCPSVSDCVEYDLALR